MYIPQVCYAITAAVRNQRQQQIKVVWSLYFADWRLKWEPFPYFHGVWSHVKSLPSSPSPARRQPTTRLPTGQAARLPVQPAQCKAGVHSAVYAAGNLYMFDTFSNTNTHIHMHIIFTKARSFMKADLLFIACNAMLPTTDYGRPERKQPLLHGRQFNPNPKFLGLAETYFVCLISIIFQIPLTNAFIGCPQFVPPTALHIHISY